MESIIYNGIFTSQGFFAILFLALGIFFLTKNRRSLYSHLETKTQIIGVISLVLAVVFFAIYLMQIKHFFV